MAHLAVRSRDAHELDRRSGAGGAPRQTAPPAIWTHPAESAPRVTPPWCRLDGWQATPPHATGRSRTPCSGRSPPAIWPRTTGSPRSATIADHFGLSRMTARQAVELLVRRGVVYRRPGSGTFVSPPRIVHTLQRLAGFSEQMRAPGHPAGRARARDALQRTRSTRPRARRSSSRAASTPGCCAGSDSATASRCCSRRSGCRAPSARSCARHDLAEQSLYDLMREPLRHRPGQRRRRRSSRPRSTPRDARHLATRPGAPAILVIRTTRAARRPAGRVRPRPLPRRPRPVRAHAARLR